jgi:hypothetical protein
MARRRRSEIVVPDGVGLTPAEVAVKLRCREDKIRNLIRSGELKAINKSRTRSARPRYLVMPDMLQAYVKSLAVVTVPTPASTPRRRRTPAGMQDYFPD